MVKNGQKWLNIQFLAIYHRLCLGMGNLFAPSLLSFTKNVITGCRCNDIYNAKVTPGYYNSIFLTFARKLNFWSFLAIFSPFVPTYGDPFTTSLLFLTKVLSLYAVAIISTERELLKATYHPMSPSFA